MGLILVESVQPNDALMSSNEPWSKGERPSRANTSLVDQMDAGGPKSHEDISLPSY